MPVYPGAPTINLFELSRSRSGRCFHRNRAGSLSCHPATNLYDAATTGADFVERAAGSADHVSDIPLRGRLAKCDHRAIMGGYGVAFGFRRISQVTQPEIPRAELFRPGAFQTARWHSVRPPATSPCPLADPRAAQRLRPRDLRPPYAKRRYRNSNGANSCRLRRQVSHS